MTQPVRAEARGPVLEVTLDRPPANAIDAATSQALGAAFTRLRDDDALRAAVLTGGGERFFSAGWDLKAAAAGEPPDADYGPGGFGGFPELPGLTKPVIAAVNGMAVGGGFELVLAAHLAVAADDVECWLPEAGLGLVPEIGSVVLPRLVPRHVAYELLLTGKRLGADDLLRLGLVNAVVPSGELLAAARTMAATIAELPRAAVAAIMAVVQRTAALPVADAYRLLRSGGVEELDAALEAWRA